MKSTMQIVAIGLLLAIGGLSLPSFDWQAALVVGAIVTVATAVVIAVAILTPFIAIQAGATILGTCLAVGAISLASGTIGGVAAGFYWGRQGDLKQKEEIEKIKNISNQVDIHFEPSSEDSKRAAEFQCTLVYYEETDLASRPPTVTLKKAKISAHNSKEFYRQVEDQLKSWFSKKVLGDADGQPRRVVIYMIPYPGEGIYEGLKQLAEQNGICRCVVNRYERPWQSALPK